jgi:hypothetical protein
MYEGLMKKKPAVATSVLSLVCNIKAPIEIIFLFSFIRHSFGMISRRDGALAFLSLKRI